MTPAAHTSTETPCGRAGRFSDFLWLLFITVVLAASPCLQVVRGFFFQVAGYQVSKPSVDVAAPPPMCLPSYSLQSAASSPRNLNNRPPAPNLFYPKKWTNTNGIRRNYASIIVKYWVILTV